MMTRKNRGRGLAMTGALTLFVLISSCSSRQVDNTKELPDFVVSCIAVAPAVSGTPLDSELLSEIEKKELDDGLYYLNKQLKKHFRSRHDVRLFSDGHFGDIDTSSERPSLQRAKDIADRLSCNAVLETTLHRYKERVGGEMTAKEPASIAFDYRLLAMPDGKVLCRESFDAEQQSLMENLLSFRDGTGGSLTWLNAEEFMAKGLYNRLENCSYLAEEQ